MPWTADRDRTTCTSMPASGGCRGGRLRRELGIGVIGQDEHGSRAGGANGIQQLAGGGTQARSLTHHHRAGCAEHLGQALAGRAGHDRDRPGR